MRRLLIYFEFLHYTVMFKFTSPVVLMMELLFCEKKKHRVFDRQETPPPPSVLFICLLVIPICSC